MSPDPGSTAREIEHRLRARFAPLHFALDDESASHAGHAGAAEGGHFRVLIVSSAFEGRPLVERHRMVHDAVRDLFAGAIHALSLRTLAPGEWSPPGATDPT